MPAASKLKPSDLSKLTEDQLGDALAKIRQAMYVAKKPDYDELSTMRDKITRLLDRFVALHLAAIDKDPKAKGIVDKLEALTLKTAAAAKEMTTAKKTIDRAGKIIGYATEFLKLLPI